MIDTGTIEIVLVPKTRGGNQMTHSVIWILGCFVFLMGVSWIFMGGIFPRRLGYLLEDATATERWRAVSLAGAICLLLSILFYVVIE